MGVCDLFVAPFIFVENSRSYRVRLVLYCYCMHTLEPNADSLFYFLADADASPVTAAEDARWTRLAARSGGRPFAALVSKSAVPVFASRSSMLRFRPTNMVVLLLVLLLLLALLLLPVEAVLPFRPFLGCFRGDVSFLLRAEFFLLDDDIVVVEEGWMGDEEGTFWIVAMRGRISV